MNSKEPDFNIDTSNIVEHNSLNNVFANSFVNSITSTFGNVYNWLEANRFLNFKNAPKEIKIVTHDEKEPHKYSKMKFWK